MPTIQIPRFSQDMSQDDMMNQLIKLSRAVEYLTQHLDHDNVKQLYTEQCDIQSANGETVIDGPLITQRDANSTTIRIKQGYDPDSTGFVYKMYNQSGAEVIGLDSTGNGVITGGTVRTASTGLRIELKDNNFLMYNSSNLLEGMCFGSTFGTFGDINFYNDGVKIAELYFDPNVFCFRPGSTDYAVQIGKGGCHTWVIGNVHHSGDLGFFDGTPVGQTIVSTLGTTSIDSIISKLNELIGALQSYNLV